MPVQADFVIRECEDCHEEMMDSERRRRCNKCDKLVCAWCWGHIHGFAGGTHIKISNPKES